MATSLDPDQFSKEWVAAWNRRDLEEILSHYADDVVLVSPRAAQVVPASGGVIRGIGALRAYWEEALPLSPHLHFVLERVLPTISGVTILYRNQRHEQVTETMLWNPAGRVHHTVAAYATGAGQRYCAIARVPPAGVAGFGAYEDAVLRLLEDHGARIERRVRTADGTTEVHLLVFPDDAALARYRADPRRTTLQSQLHASGASVELG